VTTGLPRICSNRRFTEGRRYEHGQKIRRHSEIFRGGRSSGIQRDSGRSPRSIREDVHRAVALPRRIRSWNRTLRGLPHLQCLFVFASGLQPQAPHRAPGDCVSARGHASVHDDESPALTGPEKPSATLLSDRVPQTLFSVLRDDLWAVMGRRAVHHCSRSAVLCARRHVDVVRSEATVAHRRKEERLAVRRDGDKIVTGRGVYDRPQCLGLRPGLEHALPHR
jgi:hypothetical protein